MVLVLFSITLVAGAALGFVYGLTKEPIEASKNAKTTGALSLVLPKFDNDPTKDTTTVEIDGFPIKVYTASKGGQPVGYAVETITGQGFSGTIKMMAGFKADGEVYNIEVLEHNETPGLGSKMADPDNVLLMSFKGKNPKDIKMAVKKDGGDIDAITASTISSRAYADAMERAYKAYQAVAQGATIESAPTVDPVAAVLPEHDELREAEMKKYKMDVNETTVRPAYFVGELAGYAVETSARGFGGTIKMNVGFTPDGTIHGIYVVSHDETPGFGAVISDASNPLAASFVGKDAAKLNMSLKADGGDIDAVTGSTITSKAYAEAVKRAYDAYKLTREEK